MRMDRVSWVKVEEYLRSSPTKDTVLLAVGSLENHGKHMPLGTDTLIPDRILELIEERSEVMIAPAIPYGATDYLMGFPGTVSLGTEGLIQVLRAITDCLYRYGFRRFIILNGHGGNKKAIETVGVELHNRGAWLAERDWWLHAGELHPEWKDGHGGGEETAGVLAVDPSLVDPQVSPAFFAYRKEGYRRGCCARQADRKYQEFPLRARASFFRRGNDAGGGKNSQKASICIPVGLKVRP